MMKAKLAAAPAVLAAVLGAIASVAPLWAHHSVAGEYDTSKTITIKGTVARTEWMNPHAHFWLDAKNDDGTISTWVLELPSVIALQSSGLRNFLHQGDQVTVNLFCAKDGRRARDGSRLAHTLVVAFPDGRIMDFPREWGMPPVAAYWK